MRLDKFLCESTDLTRSKAKKALHRGEVTVDGQVVKDASFHVADDDEVHWLEERLVSFGHRYLMMHKPAGVECTTQSGLYPTVLELIELPKVERLHPVGRLDVDTTGLVLLSDDGQWSHRVTSPRAACAKVYLADLVDAFDEPARERASRQFAEGIQLDGEKKPTQPATLEWLTPTAVRIVITEGKYHQVKRMIAAVGNRVGTLHRESIGPLSLDDGLAPGECRHLTLDEIEAF
ncbi:MULTISPECIES: pseudouridine synthase [unclassified Modicisalibacter]|uniref:pseudouridine synthase n=1 Tax=unclassified Modicisalibacter TaxID=2679913 RepID=UPI001CCA13FA|nr:MULTISPECIES: pseudouridine synthase [unclassified Modicisalibacter]MBZ9556720.1 pseudouridine synthase [Modicisalibacter sp. R2A 31.J]MBZ9574811.1 pseudouridine synthase [Modicisalibacter sp. MOD 31.J]